MRTSKIAQDTARAMSAMASRRRSARLQDASPAATPDSPGTARKRKRDEDERKAEAHRKYRTEKHEEAEVCKSEVNKSSRARKARRQPAKRVKGENGIVEIQAPPTWERIYQLTQEMRKRTLAPVDLMGCEALAEPARSPRDQRYQTLTALMLSSQTKDQVTAAAMKNLQQTLPGVRRG
jgi:endonuclease III